MKICILTSSYPSHPQNDLSGAFVRQFALELIKQSYKVTVLTQQKPGPTQDDKNINIIRFPWLGYNKQVSSLKIYKPLDLIITLSLIINGTKSLNKLLKNNSFDVVLALWTVPAGIWAYLAARKNKIPYIIWSLGSDIWTYGRNRYTQWLIKLIIKKSSLTFADGFGLCKEIKNITNKKCDFLPTTRTLPTPKKNKQIFPKNKVNFLFIGRYHSTKGPDILIDAISLLSKDIKEKTFFHFYGSGEMENYLKQKKIELKIKNLQINGNANSQEVSNLMYQADYLIIPSRFDSIPVVFSEAIQLNLPMIVTNVGDTGSLVKKYNIGLVCEKENPQALTDIISKALIKNKNIFLKNIKTVSKIFNNEKSVKKFIKKISKI